MTNVPVMIDLCSVILNTLMDLYNKEEISFIELRNNSENKILFIKNNINLISDPKSRHVALQSIVPYENLLQVSND